MVDNYIDRKAYYEEAKCKMWEVIWYQCSRPLQTKLESMKEYSTISTKNDCVELLKSIKKYLMNT